MSGQAEIGKQLGEKMRKVNIESLNSPSYHLLLGIFDAIAGGKLCTQPEVVMRLALECSRDPHVTLPKDILYSIGKHGFGLFDLSRSNRGHSL